MKKNSVQEILRKCFLVYQPIMRLRNYKKNEIYNYEVLLRIDGGEKFPKEEFALLSESDEINKLYLEWLFENLRKRIQCNPDIIFCVNLSPKQCTYRSTMDVLKSLHDINQHIRIEITEHKEVIYDTSQVEAFLNEMKKLNYMTGLDDVEVGQNTLLFTLKNINKINRLKLSLLPFSSISLNSQLLLVQFWNSIAKENNLEFVVEGIDTKDKAQVFREIGIELQQGFFWGEPEIIEN
ncbi:MAG: EAL domain-containing protein [Liquorilactobacillus nagelii]|uniref:EAL domain-containing protein n=1 Tax=Liquorilactobacillus nagelii TaxID=82688 RepID=UPI0024316839|nr:EAL domain-containing protein [Liquorilactobacillus nagelii]MCI1922092.1 EAL domain-containing protein [Liquorilactobacillus nagelii]MCI1977149.1 EAL domain-containing protein [Liquorilactobacillus nagelii]